MTKIIDELQVRVAESKERLDKADKEFKLAQVAFQTAQQDHNVWNLALQAETRDEQRKAAVATEQQMPLSGIVRSEPAAAIDQSPDNAEISNKTDAVRSLLKQHPAGMSAVDIWNEVRSQFPHRPYLYSVLKRLRDRQEIVKRRNRYCLTALTKPEGREQSLVQ